MIGINRASKRDGCGVGHRQARRAPPRSRHLAGRAGGWHRRRRRLACMCSPPMPRAFVNLPDSRSRRAGAPEQAGGHAFAPATAPPSFCPRPALPFLPDQATWRPPTTLRSSPTPLSPSRRGRCWCACWTATVSWAGSGSGGKRLAGATGLREPPPRCGRADRAQPGPPEPAARAESRTRDRRCASSAAGRRVLALRPPPPLPPLPLRPPSRQPPRRLAWLRPHLLQARTPSRTSTMPSSLRRLPPPMP